MAKGEKIERQRAYYGGELVTVIERGKIKSTVRTSRGFVIENVRNKDLDFKVEDELAKLRFESPTG